MGSPDRSPPVIHLGRLLFFQEIRGLLVSPSLWIMMIITSLLIGYGFQQAVTLFSRASATALAYPDMAAGMDPLSGVFVPTFGALYLTSTLLLPFTAIRIIGRDKHSGVLRLLLQLDISPLRLCLIKMGALFLTVLIGYGLSALGVVVCWRLLGGTLVWPELLVMFCGHALYALTVAAIGMCAAAITDTLPTAAMLCLGVTLGSWVLDFTLASRAAGAGYLGSLSLIGLLRHFENGLLSSHYLLSFAALILFFFLLAVIWLHPGVKRCKKIYGSAAALLFCGAIIVPAALFPLHADVTENRRHSFDPDITRALRSLSHPLTITVHLSPEDSRLHDIENGVLAKLRRTVPKLKVVYADSGSGGLFDGSGDELYGLLEYAYQGKTDRSYSSSSREILSIIFALAGLPLVEERQSGYSGHPLVGDGGYCRLLFFCFLPLGLLVAGIICSRGKL